MSIWGFSSTATETFFAGVVARFSPPWGVSKFIWELKEIKIREEHLKIFVNAYALGLKDAFRGVEVRDSSIAANQSKFWIESEKKSQKI